VSISTEHKFIGLTLLNINSYREAIDLLYSGNNSTFSNYRHFIAFARSIPPPRLACIRYITITQRVQTDTGPIEPELYRQLYEYEDFFALIASMPRLRTIDLNYTVIVSKHRRYIQQREFELLDTIEARTEIAGCEVWYEINGFLDDLEAYWGYEEGTGRMLLCGRWRVGERIRVRIRE
jgi:hypothetical protein